MVSILYRIKKILYDIDLDEDIDIGYDRIISTYYQLFPTKKVGIVDRNKKRKIIISLTTIPSRIDKVWITIESLLRQTYKPDKIILWLAEDDFRNRELPKILLEQKKRGLEIRYCENIKSYKKFYFAALENPKDYILTVDDDVIYAENMLQCMLKTYKNYPKCVVCNRSHLIKIRKDKVLPYNKWLMYENRGKIDKEPSYSNFFTGCGGTLFPMFLMDRILLEKNIFMEIAPTADDVWLNFVAWTSKLRIKNTEGNLGFVIDIESSSKKGLSYQNVHGQANDDQIKKVLKYLKININEYI